MPANITTTVENGVEVLHAGAPRWVVTDVETQSDYKILVTFVTGERKLYDCKPLLRLKVYAPLKNPEFFQTARVIGSNVGWNEDLDIDPVILYEDGVKA